MLSKKRVYLQKASSNDLNRWTVSFADFMTLMFAVFVVLYAVSLSKENKQIEIIQSIQNATKLLNKSILSSNNMGILPNESNIIENGAQSIIDIKNKSQTKNEDELSNKRDGFINLKLTLETLFKNELDNDLIKVDLDGDWLTIEMDGDLLFVTGSHTLLRSAKEQINKLAKVLVPIQNMIRIRGYTDQASISNEIYLSNWELSGYRAFSVLHELDKLGVSGQRMIMEAYGKYSPVLDKDGEVDDSKSRRVVIAISRHKLSRPEIAAPRVKQKNTIKKNDSSQIIEDSKTMREVHLPNDRLIITTRKE